MEFYEELEKKRALQSALDKQKRRVRNYAKFTASDIKNLAHEEYIEHVVQKLQQNLVKILDHEERVELREVCLLGFDRVSAYLGMLFVSTRDKYEIVQDEFYKNVYIRREQEQIEEQTVNAE